MQPFDRDTQIELMKNSEKRTADFVQEMLQVREIQDAAKRCAFDEKATSYFSRTVKVARCS
ncbi:hypothetical protein Sa4125_12360 [Aureimonas sp. SA4125]|uniref:hypothetical protein n=1 Tax=Aureimonas sp. SA4125 TaxID=2826993 RepID=UPI001CC54519|nr:hypothetical protein [Aureimonas sp. SA4125]BDA83694.1 hypothetical protein Sa4125_12360 [Aureimonas sp. SA4125]